MRFLKPHRFVDTMINFFAHESSIIDKGATIGNGTKVWHFCHVFAKAMIGDNCILGQNVMVANNVVLGNNVKVQNNVSIYEGVICEDDVFLGPSMVFTNVINPRSTVNRKQEFKQTVVEKGVTIGANATIICGNNIGKYAFIGAGAVVTKEVPDYALMIGSPSKNIGWMSEFGNRLMFNEKGIAICDATGSRYKFNNNLVKKLDE
jgi:UDP-2-acetamido-3-amino-2,3-dideoxy-glucuronate N-acetyltransferase